MTPAEQVQIELFRRATPQQRFELARSLTAGTLELAHRAIERAYPEIGTYETTGREFQATPTPPFLMDMLKAGGLIAMADRLAGEA